MKNILLSGEIYTARDAAHKKLQELVDNNLPLPFNLENKIIFYAGPCPNREDEVIGPIGPTTAARMDKYIDLTYGNGVIATIGKGERSKEAEKKIKTYNGRYFTADGGISCLLSQCVIKSECIAFEELGTEAIRKLEICRLPLKIEY